MWHFLVGKVNILAVSTGHQKWEQNGRGSKFAIEKEGVNKKTACFACLAIFLLSVNSVRSDGINYFSSRP